MRRRDFLLASGSLFAARAALGQQQRVHRLGILLLVPVPMLTGPLFAGLEERGWRVGRNLEIDTRVTAPQQSRAADMARELLDRGAELLVTVSTANAVAARQISSTVPIVMLGSGYPVESGLAASLARPGGNVTGLSVYAGSALFGKYLDVTRELVPSLRELGVFWGYAPPAFPAIETELAVGEMQAAAAATNTRLTVWTNRDKTDLEASLAAAASSSIDALFVTAGGPQSDPQSIAKIAAFCVKRRLPTICDVAGVYFMKGGVVSYSADFAELGRRAASYVDRILRGAKPGELPIEQPGRFELVVNKRFARALGLAIPQAILVRADRVIE